MQKRTIRDFPFPNDVFPVVENWAAQNGYRRRFNTENTRQYQRGKGFWTAPTMAQVTQSGEHVHLEAWVRVDFIARLFALFMLPAEMELASGGMRGVIPRNVGRERVNALLWQLGQPPIA